ncbi:trinucleotide repeat-containing gene 18 protein [Brassica napus]|uniref:trinucleotide repeat-containing gene 18 protein n=1 Tax=Brassica napus TaxID=3708 RepID=UPI0006AAFCA4|nr:trinucleotide repeat-containing gene 18 protein [Brassica napus]
MPSGAKKRKAAKKKQEEASSTLKPNNNHGTTEEEGVRVVKETGLDTDERIEITDSSHDHDKSSSSRSSGSSSSSSDDESQEVKREDGDKEETQVIITPVPVAGDAPFIIGSTANAIVENTGLMDSTTPSDPNTENIVEISSVDSVLSNEPAAEVSDESKQASSSTTGSDKKESKSGVPEGSKESEVVIFHEEEAPVRPTHGVAQRTSWLSCCGLFDVMTGSSR